MAASNPGHSGQPLAAGSTTPVSESPQRGKLLSFDAAELGGWIAGDDGGLYHVSAADVVGDVDIAIGQPVAFLAVGERALEVTSLGQGEPPARAMSGKLLSFDSADLSGWITGEDGVPYFFSAAEVIDDREITVGQSVSFLGAGEVATQVRATEPTAALVAADVIGSDDIAVGQAVAFAGVGERAIEVRELAGVEGAAQAMSGRLVSYDPKELNGWIVGEDGLLYAFTAGDVVGEEELWVGNIVAFSGVGETALNVRAEKPAAPAESAEPLHGRLVGYDAVDLSGSIIGDDGRQYFFSAADLLGDEEIAVGQAVVFVVIDDVVHRVSAVASPVPAVVPVPVVSVPAPEPVAAAQPPIRERMPVERVRSPRPLLSSTGERVLIAEPSRATRQVAMVLIAAALIGGLTYLYAFRRAESPAAPSQAASTVASPTAQQTAAVVPEPAPVAAPVAAGDAAIAQTRPESAAIAAPPDASPTQTPPTQSAETKAPAAVVAQAPPVAAEPAPAIQGADAVAAQAPVAVAAAAAKPARPKRSANLAWWPAPQPGNLNLTHAGFLAGSSAIILVFDGRFASDTDIARNIRVTRPDGVKVAGQWTVGPNGKTLILQVQPGAYEVSLRPALADADGKALGRSLSGPVFVR